jgi:hypothetical protein
MATYTYIWKLVVERSTYKNIVETRYQPVSRTCQRVKRLSVSARNYIQCCRFLKNRGRCCRSCHYPCCDRSIQRIDKTVEIAKITNLIIRSLKIKLVLGSFNTHPWQVAGILAVLGCTWETDAVRITGALTFPLGTPILATAAVPGIKWFEIQNFLAQRNI